MSFGHVAYKRAMQKWFQLWRWARLVLDIAHAHSDKPRQ
jgi:hypothetical protein